MTAKQLFSSIAAIGAAAFVLGAAVYFPLEFWNGARLFAAAMVPASLWLFAYTSRGTTTDVNLALAGITGFLCTVHLLAAVRIFAFATGEEHSLTAVFCIANLAFGAVILVVAGAAAKLIAANIERNDTGSEYSRIARDLAQWANQADDPGTRQALLALAEELRYYPRRIRQDGVLPHDVDGRAADLGRLLQARAWSDAGPAIGALRRALEASRMSVQSNYTKA